MKITIKHYDAEVTWSNDRENQKIDETTIDEAFEAFKGLLVTVGYMPESVDNYILDKADELSLFKSND